MTHSPDLVWQLVRRNSKYMQIRGGVRLSNDPMNNSGKWTRRHAGILAEDAAVVKIKGEKEISVTTKKGNKYTNTPMGVGVKASLVSKAVAAVRPDLADIAYRRARRMSIILSNQKKVRAARKARSAKITFKHKAVRPKRSQK
eukprot:Tbor_TRINITY_DN5817_c1_g1::TRINITY_DN5817_c1_g1_i3::g.6647::m.6647/K02903/RP-L28e, RPL28; large subunit ribosomal protein L28e